jgi:oligopeptide transport system ATP-binding protein
MFEARGVSKSFHLGKVDLWAVDGVDLTVNKGETHALVGESGCGKSTLARMMVLLENPTKGELLFEGRDIVTLRGRELFDFRRKVQMIFQDPYGSLNPRMRIGDVVAEPLEIHSLATGEAKKLRVAELLCKVGLQPEAAERYPREFSGGQRQRISIARALAVSPSLIIADEPLSALDVSVQAQILMLLDKLKREENLSYLIISHDLRVVEYISDRISVMYLGRIVESGKTEEVFASPMHPYTKALFAAASYVGEIQGLKGEVPSPVKRPEGCCFSPRCASVLPECRTSAPEPFTLPGGRMVRCHLCRK